VGPERTEDETMTADDDLGDPVPLDPAGVVVSDPGISGGEPVFRGTRVPVATLFDYIKDGIGLDEILADFPSLDRNDVLTLLNEAESLVVGQDLRGAAAELARRAAAE
jgi:uncharacterized protein (DUF433 family)